MLRYDAILAVAVTVVLTACGGSRGDDGLDNTERDTFAPRVSIPHLGIVTLQPRHDISDLVETSALIGSGPVRQLYITGEVVNMTDSVVSPSLITADLLDASGNVLSTEAGAICNTPMAPGEDAVFLIVANDAPRDFYRYELYATGLEVKEPVPDIALSDVLAAEAEQGGLRYIEVVGRLTNRTNDIQEVDVCCASYSSANDVVAVGFPRAFEFNRDPKSLLPGESALLHCLPLPDAPQSTDARVRMWVDSAGDDNQAD